MNKAKLIIFSGPSGSGKGTILDEVKKRLDFVYSVSATTRLPRKGEIDGVSYHFLTKEEFKKYIENGELLEYNIYGGNYYGTLKSEVTNNLNNGKDVLLEIDVNGAMNAKNAFPDALMIFIMPPSMEVLENRLRNRNTESEEEVLDRIEQAKYEMSFAPQYDYTIVNDVLSEAVDEFVNIFNKEKNLDR